MRMDVPDTYTRSVVCRVVVSVAVAKPNDAPPRGLRQVREGQFQLVERPLVPRS